MEREMLFRGKDSDANWCYGDLVHEAFDRMSYVIDVGIKEFGCYPVAVDKETVGQFTGLCDKNGVKIFENDVIKGGVYLSYEVKWDFENCGWNVNSCMQHEVEVIGNIHDND